MDTRSLAVTGSTGRLGGRVASLLTGGGRPLRLIVRDAARAPQLADTTVAAADYSDTDACREALAGSTVVFMVSGSEAPDRVDQHRSFVDAAVDAGIEHIVYTSFYAASPQATFTLARDHFATEQHIRNSGLRWTFLRDNLYLDFLPLMAGRDGVIRGPAGDGRVAAVAIDDIAEAAAAVLTSPDEHEGRTYDLTGPESLTLGEAAETISAITGRPVSYHNETIDEAYASRAGYGAPDWQLDAWVSTYTAIAAGELATPTDHVANLTGHAPRSLAALLTQG